MNVPAKNLSPANAEEITSIPLAEINPGDPVRFQNDTIWPMFERLRKEDPVHFTPESEFGPYWSVTTWNDILAVDTDHGAFSSADGISLVNLENLEEQRQVLEAMGRQGTRGGAGFITMDEPEHSVHRKTVTPTVAPANIAKLSPVVRERAGAILDSLPIGVPFDWVDLVSKELTAMTLATLFDFPFEDRRKLTHWSDMITNSPGHGPVKSWVHKAENMMECFGAFDKLWDERAESGELGPDLISMLIGHPETRAMSREQYHGTVVLLIVGGNDTTRNTISGSVYELHRNPAEFEKLRSNHDLIPSMVSETIRWQTPLAHMARTATKDVELHGKTIHKGDKVVMWYISGNRDEDMIANADRYIIDRDRPRQHLSFGFGVHRCVGNRVAEMQLTIIWEEILKRFPKIDVVEEPVRSFSPFVHGFESMQVVIPSRN